MFIISLVTFFLFFRDDSLQLFTKSDRFMKVALRTIGNTRYLIDAEQHFTVASIRISLQKQMEADIKHIRLIYDGKILEESQTLKDINYSEDRFIIIHLNKKKIDIHQISGFSDPTNTPTVKRFSPKK